MRWIVAAETERLAVGVDQADQGYRHTENLFGEPGDAVEARFRRRIETLLIAVIQSMPSVSFCSVLDALHHRLQLGSSGSPGGLANVTLLHSTSVFAWKALGCCI